MPPDASRARNGDPTAPGWFVLLGCMTLLLALKSPDAWANPQFWAEDGSVFFSQQYGIPWPVLQVTHGGYLHVLPRLVAWLANAFDPLFAPAIYNGAALAIAAVSLAFFAQSLGRAGAWVTFAAVALVPTNGEVFGNLTNVQWFTQFALLALTFSSPTPGARWPAAVASLLLALTGPFSVLIAAFHVGLIAVRHFLGRIRADRGWIDVPFNPVVHVPLYLGSLLQGVLSATSSLKPVISMESLTFALHSFQVQLTDATRWPVGAFAAFFALVFAAAVFFQAKDRQRPWLATLLFVAITEVVAAGPRISTDLSAVPVFGQGDRYFFALKIAAVLSFHYFWAGLAGWRVGMVLTGLALATLAALNPDRLVRPSLRPMDWAGAAARINGTRCGMHVQINPGEWSVWTRARDADCAPSVFAIPGAGMHLLPVDLRGERLEGESASDAYYPSVGLSNTDHPLPDRVIGTWAGRDEALGRIELVTARLCGAFEWTYTTGPSTAGLRLEVDMGAPGGNWKALFAGDPRLSPDRWTSLRVTAAPDQCASYRLVAVDAGQGWGQWIAVAMPRVEPASANK